MHDGLVDERLIDENVLTGKHLLEGCDCRHLRLLVVLFKKLRVNHHELIGMQLPDPLPVIDIFRVDENNFPARGVVDAHDIERGPFYYLIR